MVYLSIYQLLPYDRVRELFSDLLNCCPSTGTMVNASLPSVPGVLWELKSRFVPSSKTRRFSHGDETRMRVTGKRHWLHVACTEYIHD